ncbi:MAG: N-acetylmuramoyl-L-alanine amidase [Alphaproteobacteria bacterium]|nr:N-acetylmuramoyl-L-alanine amidase [Alphaproteobacteria bacterium]
MTNLSPNFNDRDKNARPSLLILHYTGTRDAAHAEGFFMNAYPGKPPVSTHYMVDEDGTITKYVEEDKRAWHAGKSWWRGAEDINSHSIGIEIVNPGHEHGYRAFPAAQMKAVSDLARDIMARHNIPAENVLAHSDVAPLRKQDPGELFNWEILAGQGVGVWPRPLAEDFKNAAALAADPHRLKEALVAYGYDPRLDLPVLVTAFQRHYEPEAFNDTGAAGVPTEQTAARLSALLRIKNTAPQA